MSLNRFLPIPEIRLQFGYIPSTAEAMQARIQELTEAKEAIQVEIRKLLGAHGALRPDYPPLNCRRCGWTWKVKASNKYPSSRCPKCHSAIYWIEPSKSAKLAKKVDEPIAAIPSPPVFPPPYVAPVFIDEKSLYDPDGVIRLKPPPIPPGRESKPDPVASPLREQISYRISQREEPQPEGFVGQRVEEVPSVEQLEDAADLNQERDRLDDLERIALEAINGSRPTET